MIGKFIAKIKDYSLSQTKTNKPQAVIQFYFSHDGQAKEFTWFGTLAPDNNGDRKGIEITLKALKACGLSMQNIGRLSTDFCKGPASGLLDMNKELSIELQEELNQEGKVITRVQWVNDPNDSFMIKKLTEAEAVQVMGGLDFTADFMKIAGNDQGQSSQGQGNFNQGQNQNFNQNNNGFNQNQNQNFNQNQNQNFNQNQGQNFNGNGQGQNFNQNQNFNQGQNGQGQNGNFKSPF